MDLLKRLEGARLFNRKFCANLSALCCLVLLTSLRTDALESSHHPPKNLELDFSKLILPKKPTEDAPAEVGEEPGPEKFEYHLTGDVFGTTKRAPEASKALAEDEPVFLPKGKTVVPKIMTKQEDEEEEPGCDDGMPMEDAVVMPAVGFGKGIMPEAEMSSELAEPFKKDLSPIRPPVTEMPVAQDSDTTQAMPQLFAKEVMSGPLLPAEQESMEEEPSFPMKETDDVSPMKSSWFGSGILDKEESVQKETEQTAEAEPQTGDMPTTGRVFWGGMTAGSIQHAIEEQTKTEEPAVKEGIEEEEQLKTDEEKAKETDLSYKALFDTTYIKEDIARDTKEQTAGESKSEEHQETELAESVKGSGGTQERTLIPFIPGTVVIPTGQKSVGSVQKSVDEPPSPSTVADEPPSSPRVVPLVSSTGAEEEEKDDVVAEETTVSTATSDVEEKKEEDTVVAEEITVSTATSDVEKMEEKDAVAAEKASAKVLGVDEKKIDDVVAEETTESTEISDEVEKKEVGAVVAEETTESTEISDEVEKKEVGAVVAEETTESTEISDEVEKKEVGAVVAEETTESTEISDEVEKKEVGAVVADETTESTEISDEVEKKEVGAVVAEETTESTEISDEVEKKEVGAVVADETTESTEISDEVEKKEVGAVVAEETTESTEISDEVEKKEVGAVVADETTESTEISDGEEIKKEDDVRAEEITVSTEISDVEEIKKEGAVVAEETTVSTEISDEVEKKEVGAVVAEETTVSTEISDEVEKKEVGAVVAEETTVSTEISDEVEKKEVGAVVAEETTVSTEISDEVEKKEVGAVVADETTESTEISDGEEIKKEDDVRAEEITVSTEISDVEEIKKEGAVVAEETTVSTEISDEVEKKEVGAVVAEETTVSTEISDEVEKKEVGAVVAEETTVSTEISDEVEKKEVGAVVADETTESTEISDGEEIKKEDDVRAEEITVSTEISDVKVKKGPADFEAEETTVSTEISDEVEKKEVGAVVAEETTESTEISDEVEKKEEIDTKDHPALSEPVSSVSSEKDPVVEVSSPSPDAIPSETPIESPPSESTPVLSQEPPQEPETKQEPAADPEKAEDVKAVELPLPEQSPAHPDEEKQVQEEDQASSSSTTEEAPVEARAAEPQAPAIQQVSTMASLKEILGSALANATNVKTDVETEEGKVAILIEEGGEVELERLELGPLEGVDILVKVAAGGELRLNDVSIRDRPQRRLRRALNGQASIKTGLLVDGGSVLSIRDSTFESATDTMIKVTQGSHLSCSGCVFRNNAGDRGGALLVQDSTLHLRSCKMTENVASSGGAIHFDGGGSAGDFVASARIEDTVFSGNEARGSGAGVYMSSARAINVVDSKFQHGSASNGGAVYIRDVYTVQIDRSRFSNNRADVSGGGLVAESIQTLSVLKSTFKNNEALGLFAGAGLISDCSDATFRATNFVENHAVEGGALANIAYSTHLSRFYLQNTQFINNKADNLGGALLIRGDKKSEASHDEKLTRPEPFLASINSTRFSGNAARKGGGVFISFDVLIDFYVKTAMQRTNFTQNKASETGGGIYCGEHSTVVLSSSKFEHNEAYAGMNCAEHCGCQVNASYIVCLNPLAFVFR